MKVLITGAQGMLGSDLCDALSQAHDVVAVDVGDFDITDAIATTNAIVTAHPEIVIHCAAMTDVDGSENDPEGAFAVNARGTWNVAQASAEAGARVVHISTDFVFDGEKGKPYTEFDPPNPLGVYGASKLAGENAVRALVPHHHIVRSAWLFGARGKNFVGTILKAAKERDEVDVVDDQVGSPTYTRDLAKAIAEIILPGRLFPGTHHLVNSGTCSWAELAAEVLRAAGSPTHVKPISAADWPSPTRRPAYSALRSRWLEFQGLPVLRDWREAIRSIVEEVL